MFLRTVLVFGDRHSTQADHLVFNDSVFFPLLSRLHSRLTRVMFWYDCRQVRGRFQHVLLPVS